MKVAKVAAIVAGVGIVVAILVIGTPAFTTLRIAGKALVSPSEGVSWMDLSQPTQKELEKAIARNPDDWKLQLVHAKRLFSGASDEDSTQPARMRDFEQVIASAPKEAAPRAAYLRWLFQQRWDYLHPTQAEERARTWPGTRTGEEAPHAATRLDLVGAAEGQLRRLSELEPNNAAWPYLLGSCRFARLDDEGALNHLGEAAAKPRFSLGHRQELAASVDAYVSLGIPRPEASLQLAVQLLFPELADMRNIARIAAALSDNVEAEGRLRQAAEIRMALIDVGQLMRRTGDFMLTALVGNAIGELGYGYLDIKVQTPRDATDEERLAAATEQAKDREKAFLGFLGKAGMEHEALRYAHGLEEGEAYSDAVGVYFQSPEGEGLRGFGLMGRAYALAPLGWITLGLTAVVLGLATAVKAFVRRKAAAASRRTIFGVGLVGGVVCLGLLAASAIVAALNPYGVGLLEALTGAWGGIYTLGQPYPGRIDGFPPAAIYPGIGLTVFVAAWAMALVLKAPRSRLWGAAFAAVCPILAVAFWGHAWLAWSAAWPMDAAAIVAHSALGIVCIAGIAAVWWAWARKAQDGARAWLPLLATVLMAAIFATLFFPISMMDRAMLWLLFLSVPIVVSTSAIVPRLVSIARLRREERPSYLDILRPGLAVCIAWILVLQFASLVWLGAWRAKAAREIEEHYAASENQAVLRIMQESREHQNP